MLLVGSLAKLGQMLRTRVHNAYIRSGLIKEPKGRMYEIRVHSLRRFLKTQMIAAGVPEAIAD